MSEINELLIPDEVILWKRIKVRNLIANNPIYIVGIFITLLNIFSFFLLGIVAINNNKLSFGIGLILIGIFFEIFTLLLAIYIFRIFPMSYRRIFKVPKEELKEYKIIYAITNQRIIIKHIRNLRFVKRFILENSISSIKYNKDFLFLDLKKGVAIFFYKTYHRICFLYNKKDNLRLMYFDFHGFKRKKELKMKEVKEILNKNFILEVYFENKYIVKYDFNLK